jgi:hypothetical protein
MVLARTRTPREVPAFGYLAAFQMEKPVTVPFVVQ